MIKVNGGVTAAKGFVANGVKAGIKKSGNKDLALLYSEVPAVAAAAFTTNRFQASPVKVSKLHIKNNAHQAIIVNSGNANCANGKFGDAAAERMAILTAKKLGLAPKEVLVASTGIIGVKLPVEKIGSNIAELVSGLSKKGAGDFARAIMTTDTFAKEVAVRVKIGGSVVSIGGAAKGVGMIHPNMKAEYHATLLSFIATDAAISKKMLESSLNEAIDDSFNMISVDGDMSTNDSCFVLANGIAGNARIVKKDKNYVVFTGALKTVARELAKMLARDGEGATKLVEIDIAGARTKEDARAIARKISTSNLLKCAIFGEDPNWGRVVAAAGSSGVEFNPDKVDVYLGGVRALSNGAIAKSYDKEKARATFTGKEVRIKVDFKSGHGTAKAWTCDFSKEYVAINSEYST